MQVSLCSGVLAASELGYSPLIKVQSRQKVGHGGGNWDVADNREGLITLNGVRCGESQGRKGQQEDGLLHRCWMESFEDV
jgi:hypothetical protein